MTCCSLPWLPWMRGEARVELGFDADAGGLELVLEQGERCRAGAG